MSQQHAMGLNDREVIIWGDKEIGRTFSRGGFTLTNQRVISVKRSAWGASDVHSIALDKIDSVRIKIVNNALFILFGVILGTIGAVFWVAGRSGIVSAEQQTLSIIALVMGVIILAIGFGTRRKTVEITSGTSAMPVNLSRLRLSEAHSLISEIEKAKTRRIVEIRGDATESSRGPQSPSSPAASTLPADRLVQIKLMRDQGLISEDEYHAKRRSILEAI